MYDFDMPLLLEDYLNYMESIKGSSINTVKGYYLDLRMFFRFLKLRYRLVSPNTEFESIEIYDIDIDLIKRVNIQDLHSFISYTDKGRENSNTTKARKVSALKSFFNYLYNIINVIDKNPSDLLESPKGKKRNPVYLTLDQSRKLLDEINNNKNTFIRTRDYCIVMMFLNCGLRLSELTSINISDIKEDSINIIGKGNKERVIFLNDSTKKSLRDFLDIRNNIKLDNPALFISIRKNRMSNRAVQHMLDRYLIKIGLDTSIYSVHKLRHTAATLMYKHGNVDIRTLQHILGHESISTTQIYTHLDDQQLKAAIDKNPLSKVKKRST